MFTVSQRILYEDNHLIAVHKLPGELSQGDASGDVTLGDMVKQYLKEKYAKPGDVFLGVIHRLDRPVSGVILFARTSKALDRMNTQLRERRLHKQYLALVAQAPPHSGGTLVHYLRKNGYKNITRAWNQERPGSRRSVLHYKVIRRCGQFFLLEIHPETGRPHQIRVQLAQMGCPIAGDVKYGFPRPLPDMSIALHAWKLTFEHPVKKETLSIEAPLPQLWESL
ncbi:MAG: RNA pseudouridine synthase [Chitinophagales bacterium]|nr:MAG: RNA pseudouridine synthase [Chitinophagales bacterium]